MDALREAREHLTGLQDILDNIEKKSESIDLEVSRQRSRIFRFWCGLWWEHLYDNKGICKRCLKKKPVKS
jgi:hypothetical protein